METEIWNLTGKTNYGIQADNITVKCKRKIKIHPENLKINFGSARIIIGKYAPKIKRTKNDQ